MNPATRYFKRAGDDVSVRIDRNYRALGVLQANTVYGYWIGKHDDYDRRLEKLDAQRDVQVYISTSHVLDMIFTSFLHAHGVALYILLAALGIGGGALRLLRLPTRGAERLWLAWVAGLGLLSVRTLLLGMAGLLT